jgi:heme/copper-type cytochrome/quinol oxidase subunit 4
MCHICMSILLVSRTQKQLPEAPIRFAIIFAMVQIVMQLLWFFP